MGALQGGGDALQPVQDPKGLQRLPVVCELVEDPAALRQKAVLRAHRRVVQPGCHRVGVENLAVTVLQQVRARTVQHPREAEPDARAMPALAVAVGLHADELHRVVPEPGEDSDRVASASHAGNDRIGQAPGLLDDLSPGLFADHPLELPDHGGIGMRPHGRAQEVVGGIHVGHPVADGLAGGVLEGRRARGDRHHLGPEQPHALHVHVLTPNILGAHVHDALEPEEGADRGSGHPVLARSGLGDDPPLAHPPGKKDLADGVVDLVRTRVVEVLALEPHLDAQVIGEPARVGERRGPAHVVPQAAVQLAPEALVAPGFGKGILQLP